MGPEAVQPYRVDTFPILMRPLLYAYGYGVGFLAYAFLLLQRPTIRVVIEGVERLTPGSNYIFCHWHEAVPLGLQACTPRLLSFLRQRPHVWMQHPAWFMKPIHVFLRMVGVRRLALGSTGHGGRQTADELVEYLTNGYSTVILPDGPHGPAKVLRRGVLHMALQSRVSIVPLQITASRWVRLRSWDRKKFPLPFTRVRVSIGKPIRVTEPTLTTAEKELAQALG